MLESIPGTNQY